MIILCKIGILQLVSPLEQIIILHSQIFNINYRGCQCEKFRVAIAELRVSSHLLEIEVGRGARPSRTPINERKCRYCNKLEDEFHFLL